MEITNLPEFQVSLAFINIFVGIFLVKMTTTNTYSIFTQFKNRGRKTIIGFDWIVFFVILTMIMLNSALLFNIKDKLYNPSEEEDSEGFDVFVSSYAFNFVVYSVIILIGFFMFIGTRKRYNLLKDIVNPVSIYGQSSGLVFISFILLIINALFYSKLKPIM